MGLPITKWAVTAPHFAAGSSVPQRARSLDEQARAGVEVAGVTKDQCTVMSIHGGHVFRPPPGIEPVATRDEPHGWQRKGALRSVHRSQDEPPRRQPVRTPLGGSDQAIVRATAHAIRHPVVKRALVGRSPAAIVLEPGMRGSDCVCRAVYHLKKDNHAGRQGVRGPTGKEAQLRSRTAAANYYRQVRSVTCGSAEKKRA